MCFYYGFAKRFAAPKPNQCNMFPLLGPLPPPADHLTKNTARLLNKGIRLVGRGLISVMGE